MKKEEHIIHKVTLQEAGSHLATLLNEAMRGEDVVISRDDGIDFRIIPFPSGKPVPKFGSAKGQVEMSADFDEPLEDFQEYMP